MQANTDREREPLTTELLRLVEQSIWANRQWIDFVYSQPNPDQRPLELLGHIVVSELVWFERIEGELKTKTMFPMSDKQLLLQGLEENRLTYQRLIATSLNKVVDFKRASGEEYHASVLDIVHHLITHGYQHRGQLAAHYAAKGVKYPNTDHINYLIVNQL